ncbi:MAG: cob(I)yrinic acid a,c-diamide adenosyltransferase [Lewinellaceae bacterium]|nr:cob(I)yrinic acid a,c-diamide adenosyltransferase [Saprospiraceae bacterium]MCB9345523.1 cob(I)yrinic acid a,c-diamide adenosyltransferase [Lewinellaceae bacterium]
MAFRIYTRTGDKGETALFGGRRVPKSHLRVDAYGTIDELNAFTGAFRDSVLDADLKEKLGVVQHRLFSIGAHLATDPAKNNSDADIFKEDVEWLEADMDSMEKVLPPLRHFILPGGHDTVSKCHICRTVCRRAERLTVAIDQAGEPVEELVLQYLNRLSDWFFVLSRKLAKDLHAEEVIWRKRNS